MTFAAPVTPPAIVSRVSDRAQGSAGLALRQTVENALDTRDLRGRGDCIYGLLTAALHQASTEGVHTSLETLARALNILTALPSAIPLPQVVVESENEIGLDWDEGSQSVLSLTVRDNPMVGYSAFIGSEPLYGRTPFFGEIPATLRFLFGRIYPTNSYHSGRAIITR